MMKERQYCDDQTCAEVWFFYVDGRLSWRERGLVELSQNEKFYSQLRNHLHPDLAVLEALSLANKIWKREKMRDRILLLFTVWRTYDNCWANFCNSRGIFTNSFNKRICSVFCLAISLVSWLVSSHNFANGFIAWLIARTWRKILIKCKKLSYKYVYHIVPFLSWISLLHSVFL